MKASPNICAAACLISAFGGTLAAEVFQRLNAAAMRTNIVGKVVTDEGHWADRFVAGGLFDAMELGQHKTGSWRIAGDEMCVTRKARKPVEECFEIWRANDRIEYRRDGVTLTTALLRDK